MERKHDNLEALDGYFRDRGGARFESVRRVFRVLDLVSREEGLTAKLLARKLGVSLSTCYNLINILLEEGYLEKASSRKGYRIGPAVSTLHERRSVEDLGSAVEPVLEELARRSGRHSYLGVLSDGTVAVSRVKSPSRRPPMDVVRGSPGAAHALALGKVLLAGAGAEGLREYVEDRGLESFTPRTIVQPEVFKVHLDQVRARKVATDVEEFERDLCCVAAPVLNRDGRIEGAIGISTSARHFEGEAASLAELVVWAAGEASASLDEPSGRQRNAQ